MNAVHTYRVLPLLPSLPLIAMVPASSSDSDSVGEVEQEMAKVTSLAQLTEKWDDTIRFYLNGTKVAVDAINPELTLLEYLRGVGLTGTKLGCAEGGCGACTVVGSAVKEARFGRSIDHRYNIQVVSHLNQTTKKIYHASVNACIAPLVSVDGKHVITVEGLGDVKKPHAIQQRIAVGNGSQCGFCTPGIVMVSTEGSLSTMLGSSGS